MKNSTMYFSLLLFIFTIPIFSQSISETEGWIENKINNNDKRVYSSPRLTGGEYIKFENGWLHNKTTTGFDENYIAISWDKIKIKDIKRIKFDEQTSLEGNNKWVELTLFGDKGTFYGRDDENSSASDLDFEYKIKPGQFLIQIRLNADFIETGLAKRVENAFKYLVTQYGGNLQIEKEPF